ncbi:hypothetical protein M1D46_14395 [Microbacterium sp. JZ70]
MLDRRTFTDEEQAYAREWFEETLQAARDVHTIGERRASEGILLALDRWFVHRLRSVAGEDTNPLTEVSLVVEAIMSDGVLREHPPIVYDRSRAVLGNAIGEHLTLTFDDVERLGGAFLQEIAARYSAPC